MLRDGGVRTLPIRSAVAVSSSGSSSGSRRATEELRSCGPCLFGSRTPGQNPLGGGDPGSGRKRPAIRSLIRATSRRARLDIIRRIRLFLSNNKRPYETNHARNMRAGRQNLDGREGGETSSSAGCFVEPVRCGHKSGATSLLVAPLPGVSVQTYRVLADMS